ncbi:TPA: hypothetical protein ACMDRY_003560 [Vibrio cholerae]
MNYPITINDFVTLESGFSGCVVGFEKGEFILEDKNGEQRRFPINKQQIDVNFKFPTFKDALFHASQSVKSSHCEFCALAKLYSYELLQKNLLASLFPNREEIIFKGVVAYIGEEYSSTCFHLLPQIDGVVNQRLINEGLLEETDNYPVWSAIHPNSSLIGKKCTNLTKAIKGAHEAGGLSSYSHIYEWLKEDNVEHLRNLRNKLLHGDLTIVNEHDASLVIMMIQCVRHGG